MNKRKPIVFQNSKNLLSFIKKLGEGFTIVSAYFPSYPDKDFIQIWDSAYSEEKEKIRDARINERKKDEIYTLLNEVDHFFKKSGEINYNNTLALFISTKFFIIGLIKDLLEQELVIADTLYFEPLEMLGKEKAVVLIDRENAFFVQILDDNFEKSIKIESTVPQKIRGGGESWKGLRETKNFRHIEWHLFEHLKKAKIELENILKRKNINEIYIGGHKETISKFEEILNKETKEKVIGKFITKPDFFIKNLKKDGFRAFNKLKF